MKKELLRMEHVYVRKSGRYALEDFHLNIYEDEFVFVYGFSDSGISELADILKGTIEVQRGTFYVEDKKISSTSFSNPGRMGIYMIQNENNLVETLSIAENLFFGGNKKYFDRVVEKSKQEMMAERLLKHFDIDIDIKTSVYRLDYFERIVLKLIMAYARGAKLIVLNDILSVMGMNRSRSKTILKVLKLLREDGISILWVNQKMDYVREMADRIIVLKEGRRLRSFHKGYDEELSRLAVGNRSYGPVKYSLDKSESKAEVLRLEKISGEKLHDYDFEIKEGEAVWVCADDVAAIKDMRDIICGERQNYKGRMYLEGKEYRPRDYSDCVSEGIVYLDLMWPERFGNPNLSVVDNLLMESYWKDNSMMAVVDKGKREFVKNRYRLMHPGWPADYWRNLSADQQKMLLLEKIAMRPHNLVIITQPFFKLNDTMLDSFVKLINEIKETSRAVLFTSIKDLESTLIADRIEYLD